MFSAIMATAAAGLILFKPIISHAQSKVTATVVLPSGFNLKTIVVPRIDEYGKSHLEIPPTIIKGGWYQYIFSGLDTSICSSPNSLFELSSASPPMSCWQTTTPVVDSALRTTRFTADQVAKEAPWRRNYSGIMSAQIGNVDGIGSTLIALTHGENKGEKTPYQGAGSGKFLNTIAPKMTNSVGQVPSGTCYEPDGCYFGFVNLSWIAHKKETNWGMQMMNDAGPITWPSAGYVTANGKTKISNGPRHPSSIIKDGYLYVYYIDILYTNGTDGNSAKYANQEGRQSGIKLIRAPLSSATTPSAYRAYYNGSFSQATLPSGFNKDTMLQTSMLAQPGPKTSPVTGPSPEPISFTVALVRDTGIYVAAEEYNDWTNCNGLTRMALRFSKDLVNWGQRHVIMDCTPYLSNSLHYPKFMNASQTSNDMVEKEGFYILGTGQNSGDIQFPLSALKVRLDNLKVSP